MNEQMLKSMNNIKEVSMDMIRSVRAVKGEKYARVLHAAILIDGVDDILDKFAQSADEGSEEMVRVMAEIGSQMITKVFDYMVRSADLTGEQVAEALREAERIKAHSYGLVDKAHKLSLDGQVMGE